MNIFYVVITTLLFCLIGYLMGSILFGSIVAKWKKTDVRKIGSNSIGATNIYRTLGFGIALMVAFADAFKAYLAIIFSWIIFRFTIFELYPDNTHFFALIYLSGTFAVLGHCFPPKYIYKLFKTKFDLPHCQQFRGGKGVATTGATIFAISPWLGLTAFGIWVFFVLITRYVSLGSIFCMLTASLLVFVPNMTYLYLFDRSLLFPDAFTIDYAKNVWLLIAIALITTINSLILIARHWQNVVRLASHEEKPIWGKK